MSEDRGMDAKGIGLLWLSPDVIRSAMDAERTYEHGRVLGLDEAQIRAIVVEWSRRYQTRPEPMSWSRVRDAMTKRAMDRQG